MNERIREFLSAENKSSAQMAEEIGVQPSGISHILSGRNNPSLDFVLKMLEKYQFLSTDWLLFGKGSMYKENRMQTLFDEPSVSTRDNYTKKPDNELISSKNEFMEVINDEAKNDSSVSVGEKNSEVVKIIWFYDDNSFVEYIPRR